jgi:UrcA family protein
MTTNKKTPAFKLYAAPVALLLMAGALATPTASAETTSPTGYKTVQAAFHYNPEAPAEQIYSKLRRLAERMCTNPSPSPLSFRRIEKTCVDAAMQDGISRIGRTDIAAFHSRVNG